MRLTRDEMVEDLGVSRRGLAARTKAKVTRDANSRREHVESLPQQGQLMRETDEEATEVWSAAVNSLPSEGLKFALNAASDTQQCHISFLRVMKVTHCSRLMADLP